MKTVLKGSCSLLIAGIMIFFSLLFSPAFAKVSQPAVMTVEECIELAIENYDLLKSRRSSLQSSSARVDIAKAELNPSLSLGGTWVAYTDQQRLSPANYDGQRGSYDDQAMRGSLNVKVPLSTGGRVENAISQARHAHQRDREEVFRFEQEITFEVSRLYYTIYSLENKVESLEGAEKSLESHYSKIENLVSAGKAASIDLKRIDVELSSVKQQKIRAEGQVHQLYLALSRLMKIDLKDHPYRVENSLEVVSAEYSLTDLIDNARKNRPDLAASLAALKAAESGVKSARSLDNPSISLTGSFTASANTEGGDDSAGYVGINVDFPLWDGGMARARTDEAKGTLDAASYAKEDLLSRIDLEVESALTDLVSTVHRTRVTRQAIESARESLRIEMLKHEMNKGTVTEVLQAQAALLQAQSDHAEALAENRIAASQLRLATGEMHNET